MRRLGACSPPKRILDEPKLRPRFIQDGNSFGIDFRLHSVVSTLDGKGSTMTMIERVARAIDDAAVKHWNTRSCWEDASEEERRILMLLARAAIEAMREPTREMALAGIDISGGEISGMQAISIYKCMVGAATNPDRQIT